VRELRAQAVRCWNLEVDRAKERLREARVRLFWVFASACVATAALVTAAVLLVTGLAGAVSALVGCASWLGELVAALVVFVAGAVWFVLCTRSVRLDAERAARAKYGMPRRTSSGGPETRPEGGGGGAPAFLDLEARVAREELRNSLRAFPRRAVGSLGFLPWVGAHPWSIPCAGALTGLLLGASRRSRRSLAHVIRLAGRWARSLGRTAGATVWNLAFAELATAVQRAVEPPGSVRGSREAATSPRDRNGH
jgi:hypothetical protein